MSKIMRLDKYLGLLMKIEEFVRDQTKDGERLEMRAIAKRFNISITLAEQIIDDSDNLIKNIALGISGLGYSDFRHKGDYIIEYIGEEMTDEKS